MIVSGIGANNYNLEKSLRGYSPEQKRGHFFTDMKDSKSSANDDTENLEAKSNESNYDMKELASHMSRNEEDILDHFDTEMASNTLANLRQLRIKQEKLEEPSTNFSNKKLSRVFVICTGGTLTMVHTPKGYVA